MYKCRNTSNEQQSAAAAKSLQSCPTLCDPIDSNTPGSPVPGILQARTLEWVAISFSNNLSITANQLNASHSFSYPFNRENSNTHIH